MNWTQFGDYLQQNNCPWQKKQTSCFNLKKTTIYIYLCSQEEKLVDWMIKCLNN